MIVIQSANQHHDIANWQSANEQLVHTRKKIKNELYTYKCDHQEHEIRFLGRKYAELSSFILHPFNIQTRHYKVIIHW